MFEIFASLRPFHFKYFDPKQSLDQRKNQLDKSKNKKMIFFIEKYEYNRKLGKNKNFTYHCHSATKKIKSCANFFALESCV